VTDIAIMTHPQRDGRLGFGELGKMVGLSTSACHTRVLRLIDANVMQIGAIRRRPETSTQIGFGIGITVRAGA
jgi:DNA-binding Lrp family transcriptional regulator